MQTGQRSTAAVINDHLRLRSSGDLEQDLARNISAAVVILTGTGVSRGHEGVRRQAAALSRSAGHEEFDYGNLVCEGGHEADDPEHLAAPEQLDHGFDEGFAARERTPSRRRVGRFSEGIEGERR